MTVSKQRIKRQKPSAAARLRPFWLLVVALVVALLAGVAALLILPVMVPRTIDVTGNHIVSSAEILSRAQIDRHRNMWAQNTKAIAQRVESIPYVGEVFIHRRPPETMIVEITERQPYAVVTLGNDQRVEVDRDLRILDSAPPANVHIPELLAKAAPSAKPGDFLKDPQLVALRDDSVALAEAGVIGARFSHDRFGDLDVVLPNGIQLWLGEESELAKKIPLVNPILHQVGRAGKPIAAIDLRAPSTPIVVYRK